LDRGQSDAAAAAMVGDMHARPAIVVHHPGAKYFVV
jgi:hypothetical protein